MSDAVVPVAPAAPQAITPYVEQAKEYLRQSTAANTRRAYLADWTHFGHWTAAHGRDSLPASPATVAAYVAALAGVAKVSTITRRLAAISQYHQAAGFESPTPELLVRKTMAGIRREKGSAPAGKAPVLIDTLRTIATQLPDSLAGKRDRALLLLGFAGAFRRSELVRLDVADLDFRQKGLVVTIRSSKTDQEGQGRPVGIPYGSHPETCPLGAVQDWLAAAHIETGPVFRGVRRGQVLPERLCDRSVALAVKRCTKLVGLDPVAFGGHSLRSGFCTSAAEANVSERSIMNQTGHRSLTVLRGYIRKGELFLDNAAAKVGL